MKKICLIIPLFLAASLASAQNMSADQFKKLSWLEGTWTRTNNKPDRSGSERWQRMSASELRGYGVSMKGKDTVFVEKLRITIKDNGIVYVADVPENQKPVYFKLTEISSTGFVCENPEHDFPKKISYQLDGTKLKATISGDGKAMDYLFVRQ